MGTRSDYYVGRGPEAEWLGSLAWEGTPEGYWDGPEEAAFPDMSARKKVAYDERSGLMFFG